MKIEKFSIPRGTADIYPSDIIRWSHLEKQSRTLLHRYGYQEIRTPIFEETALFQRSLGQTSDVVNKQLLQLASDKEDTFSLRPEGTASVVRSYIENRLDRQEPISKLFYIGPMFRGERPQKGRLRQFHQIGAEVIGPGTQTPYLDVEMISLSAHILESIGLENYTLNLNTLGSSEDKATFSQLLREQLSDHRVSLCPTCQQRFERNVFRILDCKEQQCQAIVRQLDLSGSHLSSESQDYFATVKDMLNQLNIRYAVSPQLVRGLDYYTHTVFELSYEGLGSQDAVGAGGRYNTLVQQLGGDKKGDIGAMGFALGMERLLLASENRSLKEAARVTCFVIALEDVYQPQAFAMMNELRRLGVSTDMVYQGSLKSQMRVANKNGARFVMLLGEEEVRNQSFTLKDMESGEQTTHLLADIAGLVAQWNIKN